MNITFNKRVKRMLLRHDAPMLRRSWVLTMLLALACGDDTTPTDAGADALADAPADSAVLAPPICGALPSPPDIACTPLETDYSPGADDMWPPCVSDDGSYHRLFETISTIQRVAAFEEMATLLFDPTSDPTSDDFLAARLVYQEDEGLDSRVVRRFDPHYEVPDGTDCTAEGVPAMFPDYCVGPAQIQPIVLASLNAGIAGEGNAREHAARIEAALLWFLRVSAYKESVACATVPKDCDSAWAYYTGGELARGGLGLGADIASLDPAAHDRAWDGVLAMRCWRDIDPGDVPADVLRRDLARAQYDRAVIDGVAALVRARLAQLCVATGDELAHHWAYVQILGGVLDLEATSRDATHAATLRDAIGQATPADVDVAAAMTAIDALFTCP